MDKHTSHELRARRAYRGEKTAKALAKWLNKPPSSDHAAWLMDETSGHALVERFLMDAQTVFRQLAKFQNVAGFHAARRKKQLSAQFWKSYERLNDTLGEFALVPFVDFESVYEGRAVSWSVADQSPVAHVARQLNRVLGLLADDAVEKVRRCKQCQKWFFARFSHQTFCKSSCQHQEFSLTDDFRAKRAAYMREYRRRSSASG